MSEDPDNILRKGIKFSNYDEFVAFIDSPKKKKKKKKKAKKRCGEHEEREEEPDVKKPQTSFKVDQLRHELQKKSPGKHLEEKEKLTDAKKKLHSSRFRFLNERLYTQSASKSKKMFNEDKEAFNVYHKGFMDQLQKWPEDPLEVIVSNIKKRPGTPIVADFGCGEARLAKALTGYKVHSFDFVALNDLVVACDVSNTPLKDESVHVVVFCLSLMGTNLKDFIIEACRVLKAGGSVLIAEVESRFQDKNSKNFLKAIKGMGLSMVHEERNNYFVFFEFVKKAKTSIEELKKKTPAMTLSPCIYKKR